MMTTVSLPVPSLRTTCRLPANSPRLRRIRSQAIDFSRIGAGYRKNFAVSPWRQGNFAICPTLIRRTILRLERIAGVPDDAGAAQIFRLGPGGRGADGRGGGGCP